MKCTTTTAEMFFLLSSSLFFHNKQTERTVSSSIWEIKTSWICHACLHNCALCVDSIISNNNEIFSLNDSLIFPHRKTFCFLTNDLHTQKLVDQKYAVRWVKEMQNCSRTGGMRKKEVNKSSYIFFSSVFSEHNPSKSCKTLKRFTWFSCYFSSLPTQIHSLDVFFFLTFTVVLNSQLSFFSTRDCFSSSFALREHVCLRCDDGKIYREEKHVKKVSISHQEFVSCFGFGRTNWCRFQAQPSAPSQLERFKSIFFGCAHTQMRWAESTGVTARWWWWDAAHFSFTHRDHQQSEREKSSEWNNLIAVRRPVQNVERKGRRV